MSRYLRAKIFSSRTVFLLGCLLMVVYLCREYSGHTALHADVQMDGSQISPNTKNTSYVYWQRCERNMSANSITNFSSLPGHIQDFLYHRHCRHFPMILDLPHKCGGPDRSSEVFLLLVIKSPPHNYDRREVLRKTWANERLQNGVWIRRLFIAGTTGTGFEKKRLNKVLELEQSQHYDILQWDFMDTFFNLTLKQVLFLEWMERNCPKVHFLLNGDDDVFVNSHNVVKYLQNLKDNNGSKHLFTGYLIDYARPIRAPWSKYFVPVQLFESDSYLPYCGGGGFFLSGYTALVIYNMSQSIVLFPIDDAYMGMCLAKAGLRPGSHIGVKTTGLYVPSNIDEYDPCFYNEILLVHRFLSAEMIVLWHRINDPNLKCVGSLK
ncbi:N-acetyllactosaminide beta-1,3-N-acetylglucosaminyltransferase 3-like [Cheilinus undulatus]|uniref:N-acetyllactosaminide beta-1,3-N-acetylglucosaminyltransferase 3-like n=1 Tax=Cheilinus undulatus TaxID=241271 RepID=UPI001BD26418|nr:N-acetyllactosaminide beta-1,3-N-acetylglucosaminyltransferase 3-like [Cheilinus undulatus]